MKRCFETLKPWGVNRGIVNILLRKKFLSKYAYRQELSFTAVTIHYEICSINIFMQMFQENYHTYVCFDMPKKLHVDMTFWLCNILPYYRIRLFEQDVKLTDVLVLSNACTVYLAEYGLQFAFFSFLLLILRNKIYLRINAYCVRQKVTEILYNHNVKYWIYRFVKAYMESVCDIQIIRPIPNSDRMINVRAE